MYVDHFFNTCVNQIDYKKTIARIEYLKKKIGYWCVYNIL